MVFSNLKTMGLLYSKAFSTSPHFTTKGEYSFFVMDKYQFRFTGYFDIKYPVVSVIVDENSVESGIAYILQIAPSTKFNGSVKIRRQPPHKKLSYD